MSTETITFTRRFEVVKPLDGEWDDLGRMLRALRTPLHRVLNTVVRELELKRPEAPWWKTEDAPKPKKKAKKKKVAAMAHPQTASYRVTRDAWAAERREADERRKYPGDEDVAEFHPSSATVLGVAGAAYDRWKKFDKERWRGDTSLPSFSAGSPIYLTVHGVKIRAKDGDAILSLRLCKRWEDLIIAADGGAAHATLRELLEGKAKIGSVSLIQERDRRAGKQKWFAHVACTAPRRIVEPGQTMAIHRGVKCFLTCAVARGESRDAYTTILEDGGAVLAHKAAYTARRRSLGRHKRNLGHGSRGHGLARREELITRIEDAEARWVKTRCQEIAAHACRLAERKGVSTILVEDWTNPAADGAPGLGERVEYLIRSWPFAQLLENIKWAAKRRGLEVKPVHTDGNSRTCPGCGHVHDVAQFGVFRCVNCQLERPADVIFAWNMLLREGKTPGIKEANKAEQRARDRLLKGRPTP